jgi:hypothetical protein
MPGRGGAGGHGARGGPGASDEQSFSADGHDWNSFRSSTRWYPWGIGDPAQTDVYLISNQAWFSNGSYDGKDILRTAGQVFPVAGTITKVRYYIAGNTASGNVQLGFFGNNDGMGGGLLYDSGALETQAGDFTAGRTIDVGLGVGPNQLIHLGYNCDGGFTSDGAGSPNNRFVCAQLDSFYPVVGFPDSMTQAQFVSANRLAYGWFKATPFLDGMPDEFPSDAAASSAAASPSNPVACRFFPLFLFQFEASP